MNLSVCAESLWEILKDFYWSKAGAAPTSWSARAALQLSGSIYVFAFPPKNDSSSVNRSPPHDLQCMRVCVCVHQYFRVCFIFLVYKCVYLHLYGMNLAAV